MIPAVTRERAVVTASDAGAAVGVGKAAMPQHLWQVKVGNVVRSKQETAPRAHGIKMEPKVRNVYEKLMGCRVLPTPFRLHYKPEWDMIGIVFAGSKTRLTEIKCPLYASDWDFVPPEYTGLSFKKFALKLAAQTQFQMEVWNIDECDVVCYFHSVARIKIFRVVRSAQYWKWMSTKLRIFIEHVQTKTEIPKGLLPYMYYDVENYIKNDYKYSQISTAFTKAELPPRVYTQIAKSERIPSNLLLAFDLPIPVPPKPLQRTFNLKVIIMLVFLLFFGLFTCYHFFG